MSVWYCGEERPKKLEVGDTIIFNQDYSCKILYCDEDEDVMIRKGCKVKIVAYGEGWIYALCLKGCGGAVWIDVNNLS